MINKQHFSWKNKLLTSMTSDFRSELAEETITLVLLGQNSCINMEIGTLHITKIYNVQGKLLTRKAKALVVPMQNIFGRIKRFEVRFWHNKYVFQEKITYGVGSPEVDRYNGPTPNPNGH